MEHVIDAKGKSLGRAASEAAMILRGKNRSDFAPNKVPDVKLVVVNADKIKLTGKKGEQKKYRRHSGYIGSQKTTVLNEMIERKGMAHVFQKAVKGMIPKNKLRDKILKNLLIK